MRVEGLGFRALGLWGFGAFRVGSARAAHWVRGPKASSRSRAGVSFLFLILDDLLSEFTLMIFAGFW